jgi:hypothetical protein
VCSGKSPRVLCCRKRRVSLRAVSRCGWVAVARWGWSDRQKEPRDESPHSTIGRDRQNGVGVGRNTPSVPSAFLSPLIGCWRHRDAPIRHSGNQASRVTYRWCELLNEWEAQRGHWSEEWGEKQWRRSRCLNCTRVSPNVKGESAVCLALWHRGPSATSPEIIPYRIPCVTRLAPGCA